MPGSSSPDVIFEPRLGARKSARRDRVTIGDNVPLWFEVRDDITGLLVPGATGAAALYWLPDTVESESAAQPLEPAEVSPGTWLVQVPTIAPGTYVVWLSIEMPTRQRTEIRFDLSSIGEITVGAEITAPWSTVHAAGAASGALAGVEADALAALGAIARQVAVVNVARADVLDKASQVQINDGTAAASEVIAANAAELAQDSKIAAGDATAEAESARDITVPAAAIATAKACAALGSANTALVAASAASVGDNLYIDPGTGQAATAEGSTFNIASVGGAYATAYHNVSGAALVQSYPSKAAPDAVPVVTRTNQPDVVFSIRDEAGFWLTTVTADGTIRSGATVIKPDGTLAIGPHTLTPAGVLSLPQIRFAPTSLAGFRIRDEAGFISWQVDNAGLPTSGSGGTIATALVFSASEMAEEDARCRAISSEPSRRYRGDLTPLTAQILHFIMYGQSLSVGYEGYPAITKAQPYDNLMAGLSTHGVLSGATWTQIGAADFNPLIGTVRGGASGVMTPAEVLALPVTGNGAAGETVGEGALNFLRRAYLDAKDITATAAAPYEAHRFLTGEIGAAGQSIEVLSKGNASGLYQRVPSYAAKAKAIATSKGLSYGVAAYLWLQGEANYDTSAGNVFDKAGYKTYLRQMVADLHSDIAVGVAGQVRPAGFFTYQTSASFVRDTSVGGAQIHLGPSMAQWEVSEEDANVIMVAPSYPYPDKAGHLTANGYRQLGEQFGKVMRKVILLKQDFRPLCPVRVRIRGRQILMGFNVPAPPLAWGAPWAWNGTAQVAMTYANRGFVVVDGLGTISSPQVDMVGDCVVRLTMTRDPVGQVYVRYGSQVTGGQGCLMDSDDTPSSSTFSYLPADGAGAPDNIPALIDKPYPLNNWCILFEMPAVAA